MFDQEKNKYTTSTTASGSDGDQPSPKQAKELQLPDEFYRDLGLEPGGLPDLSDALSELENRTFDEEFEACNLAEELDIPTSGEGWSASVGPDGLVFPVAAERKQPAVETSATAGKQNTAGKTQAAAKAQDLSSKDKQSVSSASPEANKDYLKLLEQYNTTNRDYQPSTILEANLQIAAKSRFSQEPQADDSPESSKNLEDSLDPHKPANPLHPADPHNPANPPNSPNSPNPTDPLSSAEQTNALADLNALQGDNTDSGYVFAMSPEETSYEAPDLSYYQEPQLPKNEPEERDQTSVAAAGGNAETSETVEAQKSPSLRQKFRTLRKHFIFSVILNVILIIGLVTLGFFYYHEKQSASNLEPIAKSTTDGNVRAAKDQDAKDKAVASGSDDEKDEASKDEDSKESKEEKNTSASQDKSAAKHKTSGTKKAAETKKDTTTKKTTTAANKKPETKDSEKARATTKAEEVTTPRASTSRQEISTKTKTTTAAPENPKGEDKDTSGKVKSEPQKAQSSQAQDAISKAKSKAEKLSLTELATSALDLNYYELSANPENNVGDLVLASGLIQYVYDDGFLVIEDYLGGGLTFYHCPWFVRFENAEELGLSEGQVVNFYGIYREKDSYTTDSDAEALIVEGVDYLLIG